VRGPPAFGAVGLTPFDPPYVLRPACRKCGAYIPMPGGRRNGHHPDTLPQRDRPTFETLHATLRQLFGDPPYHPVGTLNAEHYAALAAEHERDPNLSQMLMRGEEKRQATPAGADGPPAGPGEQPPDNTQSGGPGQGGSV